MRGDEWDGICALLEHAWPGEFPDTARAVYRMLLDERDAGAVVVAVRNLASKGKRFRPSAAEIIAELRSDPTRPTFDEMLAVVRRVVPVRPDEAALDRADRAHELIGAFVRSQTLDRLRYLPIDDPEYGELRRNELRADWNAFLDHADERRLHGLELAPGRNGTLRQLEPHETLRQLAPPGHVDHHRPAAETEPKGGRDR